MTTEERFEKLERELAHAKRRNRWLMLAGLSLALGLCASLWAIAGGAGTAQAQVGEKAEKIIRANKFILEDADGKTRAVLVVFNDEPRLLLSDKKGKTRVFLAMFKNDPVLCLRDEKGKTRAFLDVNKYGPGLSLLDEKGKTRATLAVLKSGPMLRLYDEKSKIIWQAP